MQGGRDLAACSFDAVVTALADLKVFDKMKEATNADAQLSAENQETAGPPHLQVHMGLVEGVMIGLQDK